MTRRRLQGRGPILGYAGVAGALFLLSGCADWDLSDDTPAQYAAVCVDQRTGNRLADDACGDWDDDGMGHVPGTYFLWMPTSASNAYLPPVGGHLPDRTPAVTRVPKGTPLAKGVPASGGKVSDVQRGGFGKTGISGGSKAGAAAKAGSGSGGKSGGS